MKVLQFCHKSPYPPVEGGPIAINNITHGLIDAGHNVKIFTISTPKFKVNPDTIPDEYIKKTDFEYINIDTRVKPLKAFLSLFSEESYNIERFVSDNVTKELIRILQNEQFDIIQLESLYVTPYLDTIRKYSNARVILRAHNIEYLVWERLSKTHKNIFLRPYLSSLAKKLQNYELSMLNKYDGIATITRNDAVHFLKNGCSIPLTDIPFGIDTENYRANGDKQDYYSLFFIGSMDWMPNEEGIRWFLQNVWPSVLKNNSMLNLHIAGRNFPQWLKKSHLQNTIVYGEVQDAREFMRSKGIMVAPLLSGSGIRVKIIEGMALGKTIISTTIGAEGINCTNGVDILIANTPEEFSKCINELINNKQKFLSIGQHARELVKNEHDSRIIINNLVNFYSKILTS